MLQPPEISYECLEQVHTWITAHCPCALEDDEFLPGFRVIIEEELIRALAAQRQALLQRISEPSIQ
jgi:hypothetical protein